MTNTEQTIQNQILVALSRDDARLFRCNTGQAWTGRVQRISQPGHVLVQPGDVVLRNARPFHAGLTVGGSDLIGWRTVVVTPGMMGQRVALFSAVEVKSAKGSVTSEQARFIAAVRDAGGLAGVARSVDEARRVLDGGGDV